MKTIIVYLSKIILKVSSNCPDTFKESYFRQTVKLQIFMLNSYFLSKYTEQIYKAFIYTYL